VPDDDGESLPSYVRALSEVAPSKEKQLDVEEVVRRALAKAKDARGEGEIGASGWSTAAGRQFCLRSYVPA
jgi:hypothetical protein